MTHLCQALLTLRCDVSLSLHHSSFFDLRPLPFANFESWLYLCVCSFFPLFVGINHDGRVHVLRTGLVVNDMAVLEYEGCKAVFTIRVRATVVFLCW